MGMPIRGRCIQLDPLVVRTRTAVHELPGVRPGPAIRLGDIVEVNDGITRVLTPHRSTSFKYTDRTLDPRRMRAASMRSKVENAIRSFFQSRDFLETRTPLLVPCPGMEPHIRTFQVETGAYLPTSPEFAMKRLLVGGLERIFQICPAFRREPMSSTHHPEFTMLEWYRAYAGYEEIQRDTEELFAWIARAALGCAPGDEKLRFGGREIRVTTPWPRLRVRDLFLERCGVDLVRSSSLDSMRRECQRLGLGWNTEDTWDDLYFRIWLNLIEPRLPADQAVFVTRYPASQAALAVVDADPDGSRWAKRFEVYAGGLELGNAFEELTDPIEQRRRFVEDMELRARQYGPAFPPSPIDEDFLDALEEGLPPSGGIAMGVDRIVMLFADEADIDRTLWLPSCSPDPG